MRKIVYLIVLSLCLLPSCKKDDDADGTDNNYLTDKDYDKLIIEIQSVAGHEPTDATINNLVTFLKQYLHKPAGIRVVKTFIAATGKSAISLPEIKIIESSYRQTYTAGKTLVAYILFLDAEYNENSSNSKVLGLAYSRSSMVLFEKTIRDYSGGIGEPSTTVLESTVCNHEFAHVIGLTNNGVPLTSEHQDVPNGAHCTNQNCLMYWSAETSDLLNNIVGNNIPQLDEACIRDLKASGGK
jgi:hypothetical protein